MLAAGCSDPLAPVPPEEAVQQADAAVAEAAALDVRLIRSFDAAATAPSASGQPGHPGQPGQPGLPVLARLSDPNERVALAAARSAGRAGIRTNAEATQRSADALAEAIRREDRPAVLAAQVDSLINLLANRQGLPRPAPRDAGARTALASVSARADGEVKFSAAAASANEFLRAPWGPRPGSAIATDGDWGPWPRLGPNVYDGPGFKADRPKIPTRKRVPPYPEPIHAVPIVSAGEVHVGDLTGEGGADYLIIDTRGRSDGLFVRVTIYQHATGRQIGQYMLAGDDRPVCFPPGELADLDGDGRAEIVYADRAGRIVVRNSQWEIVRRSEPFRTLDGEPYFGDRGVGRATSQPDGRPGGGPGRLWLANLRGAGRCDLLLIRDNNLLALTDRLQPLWHVVLALAAPAARLPAAPGEPPTLLCDLGGAEDASDSTRNRGQDATASRHADTIIRGNVAIDHTGRVMWTWPHTVTAVAAGPFDSQPSGMVMLADSAGCVGGFDAAGLLWQVNVGGDIRQLLAGRFVAQRPGRWGCPLGVDVAQPGGPGAPALPSAVAGGRVGSRAGILLNGLGQTHLPTARTPPALPDPKAPPVQIDPLGEGSLVADWTGGGLDTVWARDKSGIPGWFKWPGGHGQPGQPVVQIPQATRLIGLYDVDGGGVEALLYFQGESLVIHRR